MPGVSDDDAFLAGATLAQRVAALPQRVNADAALVRRGRFLTADVLLGIGPEEYLIRIREGSIAAVSPGPLVMPSVAFAIAAAVEDWAEFCAPVPAPGRNDLFALLRRKRLKLTGDLHPFMANLLYFKAVLAHLRDPA